MEKSAIAVTMSATLTAVFINDSPRVVDRSTRKNTPAAFCFVALLCGSESAQSLRCALGSDVALWCSQHFEADHVLANRGRAQQRRIKMRVKMVLRMVDAIGGRLVESHRIREGNYENFVVGGRDATENLA